MSNVINLTSFKLRQPVNTRSALIARLEENGVDCPASTFRAGVQNLTELVAVVKKAKEHGVRLALPDFPEQQRRRRYMPDERFLAMEKHDAVNMSLAALGEHGMTAGLAATFSGRDLSNVLKAFEV